MFATVFVTQIFLKPSILFTFILILEGIMVYFLALLCLKEKYVLKTIKKLSIKISHKKDRPLNTDDALSESAEDSQKNEEIITENDEES